MNDQVKAVDEKFCSECSAVIKVKTDICPKCGVRQINAPTSIDITMISFVKFIGWIGLIALVVYKGINISSGQRSFLLEMWANITGDKTYTAPFDIQDRIKRKQENAALVEQVKAENAEVGYEKFTVKKQEEYSWLKDLSLYEQFEDIASLVNIPYGLVYDRKKRQKYYQDRYSAAPRLERTEANRMFKHYRDPVSGVAIQTDERIPAAVNSENKK